MFLMNERNASAMMRMQQMRMRMQKNVKMRMLMSWMQDLSSSLQSLRV